MSAKIENVTESGTEVFIPLNKLRKSPRNARKTPHSEAAIEAYAASIAAKGILQNLVVEPELDADGAATGFYLVTIGEGRRLAQLLRVKRKQIKKTEPIRCVLDTANDPHEISLDENVTRTDMHPADQYEAFRQLAEERGYGAEDIAARFGVTAHVVRQRLRLGAVSPKLMQAYREAALTLDQLMAFALTEDHARQEDVFDRLTSWHKEPYMIRRMLTETHVAATDRRAIFVGPEAYAEAGGVLIRDLFTEDRGGFYEDAGLLDRLVIGKLEGIAEQVRAEGWKWATAHVDYPHAHGLRRTYPLPVALSADDEAAYEAAQAEFNALSEQYESADELPDDVDQRFGELEAEIERIDAKRQAFDPDDIARGGALVVLSHDGTVRVERGFVRPEDENPEADAKADGWESATTARANNGYTVNDDGEIIEDGAAVSAAQPDDEDADDGKPLSDLLIRNLTAHRTLGLRLALGEQPDMALIAVTHALAAQTFYRGLDASCLEIRPTSAQLAGHADGIENTAAAKALADRHAGWATDMPREVADLWGFIASLDHASVMALFAYCASLTVNAVKQPWERKPRAHETADKLAYAVSLDMTAHWTPTARTYLGRVTKAHILAAVREAMSDEAADRMAGMKKQAMAETAEQLLAGTGWLPSLMRTPEPAGMAAEQPEAREIIAADAPKAEDGDGYSIAAE
ncbi:chromosome partitioning protein ParB [Bosea sp. Root483D1]|uniref:ParB/RepB/Spo0J family partition protein n=1 Tax=Bosea sp. Root483D1 TaxID=1736544 RepID=UPI000709DD9F|nr:ParB/Srx family N-terminal domain-containing protein [Bosea sp. Root483D1]KRE12661.1 chromosome partitioning protein ParB [Bosea sp. Root483D1]